MASCPLTVGACVSTLTPVNMPVLSLVGLSYMQNPIRVEIIGRNEFWRNAVFVEWEHQFPDRKIVSQKDGYFLIDQHWLEDLQRVASQVFSKVVVAPSDPGRRHLFRRIFQGHDQD